LTHGELLGTIITAAGSIVMSVIGGAVAVWKSHDRVLKSINLTSYQREAALIQSDSVRAQALLDSAAKREQAMRDAHLRDIDYWTDRDDKATAVMERLNEALLKLHIRLCEVSGVIQTHNQNDSAAFARLERTMEVLLHDRKS